MKYLCLSLCARKALITIVLFGLMYLGAVVIAGELPEQARSFRAELVNYHFSPDENQAKNTSVLLEGALSKNKPEDANTIYLLSVKKIQIDVTGHPNMPSVTIHPFDLEITADKSVGELRFRFLDKNTSDTEVRYQQTRMGFDIFELAMLDVIQERYVISKSPKVIGDEGLVLETDVYESYNRGDGRKDIRQSLTGGIKIKSFKVVPLIKADSTIEQVLSYIQIHSRGLDYQVRSRDLKTGSVLHAVKLSCSYKTEGGPIAALKRGFTEGDLRAVLQNMDKKEYFNNYYFSELTMQ